MSNTALFQQGWVLNNRYNADANRHAQCESQLILTIKVKLGTNQLFPYALAYCSLHLKKLCVAYSFYRHTFLNDEFVSIHLGYMDLANTKRWRSIHDFPSLPSRYPHLPYDEQYQLFQFGWAHDR